MGEAVAGRGPPRKARVWIKAGRHSTLAGAYTCTHLGCDCLFSVVPSKGPWPLSLEESGSSQGLCTQERKRAARAAAGVGAGKIWWAQAGK